MGNIGSEGMGFKMGTVLIGLLDVIWCY